MAMGALSAVRLPSRPQGRQSRFDILGDMKQGVLAIRANKALLRLAIPMLISTVVFVPLGTLLPLMVLNYFSGTAWHNGLVQTLFSLGTLASAMVISLIGGPRKQFLMISVFTGLLGFCALLAGLIPAGMFGVFCLLVFLMGSAGSGFNIPFTAYVQKTVPPEHLGKVLSLITSIMSFAAPVGMFVAGPVAEVIGINNWMRTAGIVMILVGAATHLLTRAFDAVDAQEALDYE